ncbi:MAG TPA: TIGR03435 family protein [Bryobacteraceae bacterium]|nr:TIGR03435 family protein [Bryobacteraceae bacterium]
MPSRIRKLVLLIAFAAISGGALFAQNITGTWQGSLQPPQGPQLRIVIKISRADNESLKAVLYSIDQGAQPVNASSISLQGANLKMAVLQIGGNYDGKLSADGNSIAGTWTQGGPMSPLNLTRATPEIAWAIPEPPPPPKPMAADVTPGFEVATIKPSNPDTPGQSILVGRGGSNLFTTTNTTLSDLITFAYGIHVRQVTGGPGWLETEKYDLTAKPDQPGIPNDRQLRAMLQKLLAERFQLEFRRDKKELSAYTITLGKGGPKLSRNETGGNLPGFGGRGPGSILVRNSTMAQFAGFLQARIVDRPVVDQTGLTDKYDFTLTWRPDPLAAPPPNAPPPPADLDSRSDLFTAIQEQLGLKLEAAKTPVEVLVIEKVQKPSEN